MPRDHPAAEQDAVRLEDLHKDHWIAEPRGDCLHFSVRACEATGFKPSVRFLSSDYRLSLALVEIAGVVTLIPQLALEEPPPGVAVRPLAGTSLMRRIDATYRVGAEGTPALDRMIHVLRSVAATYNGKPAPSPQVADELSARRLDKASSIGKTSFSGA